MNSGQACNKPGKRKRSVSDLEDLENLPGPSWRSDWVEQQRKRMRESPVPVSPPLTPIALSPRNFDSPDFASTKSRWNIQESQCTQQSRTLELSVSWLNRSGFVDVMIEQSYENASTISPTYFSRHPNLEPRMRSVLLDWLIEVCEAYKMHRETYYLSVNYLDRYLSVSENVAKTSLQLIGITALFIASKVEEIYPPKLKEFAYVTNEACTTEGILNQELIMLDRLKWNLGAVTVNGWLNLLLQLWHNRDATQKSIIFPNHPVKDYLLCAQLLDLASLDETSLGFSYQAMAAAAIHIMTDFKDVLSSPLIDNEKLNIFDCVRWMTPFAEAIRERTSPRKNYANIDYTLQTHHVDLLLLDCAQNRLKLPEMSSVAMTPPPSNGKPRVSSGI